MKKYIAENRIGEYGEEIVVYTPDNPTESVDYVVVDECGSHKKALRYLRKKLGIKRFWRVYLWVKP